jgi:hypothetical protein
MILKFHCPKCGQRISVEESSRDTQGFCPNCSAPITVPIPSEPVAKGLGWRRILPFASLLVIMAPFLYYGFLDGLHYLNLRPGGVKNGEEKNVAGLPEIDRGAAPNKVSDPFRADASGSSAVDSSVRLVNDFFRDYAELLGNLQKQLGEFPMEKRMPETLPKDAHTAVMEMGKQGKRVEILLKQQKALAKLIADTHTKVKNLRDPQNPHVYGLKRFLENHSFTEGIDLMVDSESADYLLRMDLAMHFQEIRVGDGKLVFKQSKDREEYDNNLRMRTRAESRLQEFQKTATPQVQAAEAGLKSNLRQ